MLAHIIKLMWNRKRSNILIITEVVITFIVLFAITSVAISNYQTFKQPLGFNWQNTWTIQVSTGAPWNNETDQQQFEQLVLALRQKTEIASVGMSYLPVFKRSRMTSIQEVNGQDIYYQSNYVDQNGPKNWGVELVAGRWFSEQDNGQNYKGIMINQRFVDEAFQGTDPVGFEFSDPDHPEEKPTKIVGIFQDFRQMGEFSKPLPYMLLRYRIEEGNSRGMYNIHLTFDKKQVADYEEILMKTLKGVAPNWEFTITTWQALRKKQINMVLVPLGILAVVVGFLLIMVAMGLFGVLWQNISRRTQEIGLRRALGASASAIKIQIIAELVVLSLFAISIATVILIQVPLLQLFDSVTWLNFWFSFVVSLVVILIMVILCALYPSRTAIKLPPALALHYE